MISGTAYRFARFQDPSREGIHVRHFTRRQGDGPLDEVLEAYLPDVRADSGAGRRAIVHEQYQDATDLLTRGHAYAGGATRSYAR